MTATLKNSWEPFSGDWALGLRHFPTINGGSFITSSSSGALALCCLSSPQESVHMNRRAHESSINALDKIDEFTLASASTDGIKVWDLRQSMNRAQLSFTNTKRSNFLSLGSSAGHLLAGGTELVGSDAELLLWDLKNPGKVVRSFVDSHHDDITDIKFHPNLPYLMSGSTDGYVNIYNLEEPDEEEALHQVINFASVHSCHFVQANRISVLSHMETLAFWELNNTNYEAQEEPRPKELGDVRSLWPACEYVVDISNAGYVAYGANSQSSLTIMPFNAKTEEFSLSGAINLMPAHGEEVVRDVMYIPGTTSVLTCGEDGLVKAWELPGVLSSGEQVSTDLPLGESPLSKEERKEEKRRKKEKKEKKDRKEKKEKKRSKADVRFKPY
ncbi:hypothetical protein JCM33374_g6200 [Metschnikowia sp. JCM 33374]|nr:hypothetical protein JCM33374_g6200 [Metschnikowia sp. JCM 33374]